MRRFGKMNSKILVLFAFGLISILIYGLGGALVPLLIAFGLAYLLFPFILRLEKKGIRRHVAVVAIFLAFSVVLAILTMLFVPWLIAEVKSFLQELPQSSSVALEKIEEVSLRLGYPIDLSTNGIKHLITENATDVSAQVFKTVPNYLKGIFSNFFGILLFLVNLALIPLFFFHVINDYEKISKEIRSLIPPVYKPRLQRYLELTNTVLSGYIRGQLMVVSILAVLYSVGFTIAGLRFGLLIGMMTGILSIIPFVGSLLGAVAALTIALANFTGIGMLISIAVVFAIVQGLEGTVITPKLVGNKVGLGVLATMLSLMVGGNLFGLVGMILAIPAAAILKAIFIDLKKQYQGSDFYRL